MAMVLLLPSMNAPIAKFIGPSVGPLVFLPVLALLVYLGVEYCRARAGELPAAS